MTLLEVRNVSFAYKRKLALDAVSLSCDRGVSVLLGPNGAGKSTLMRLVSGSLRLHNGEITVVGVRTSHSIRKGSYCRSIGWLPQSAAYVPGLSTRDYVAYAGWLQGVPNGERAKAVEQALARVRLLDRADEKLHRLSGGMLRRAAIATAIVHEPPVLLLDEPTSGLDPEQRAAFHEIIRELATSSCVLVSTHSSDEVASIGQQIYVLNEGHLMFSGSLEEFEQKADLERGKRSSIDSAYIAVIHDDGAQ